MKLTKETIALLKNCAELNSNLLIREGKQLRTYTTNKSVMLEASIEEEFKREVGIYDLPRFLKVLSLMGAPEVELLDEHILISSGNRKTKFLYSDTSTLSAPPQRELKLPSEDASFKLSGSNLKSLLKASEVLDKQHIRISGDGEAITLFVEDKQFYSDTYEVELYQARAEKMFDVYLRADNLKHLMESDYEVVLCKKNLALFTSTKAPVHYFVALEPDSSWEMELVEAPAEEPAKAPQKKVKKEAVAA